MEYMGMVGNFNLALAFAALIGAAGLDLRSRRIPNFYNISVLVVAVLYNLMHYHIAGLWISLAGIAAAVAIGLPVYLMKVFAGGDFKLLLAIAPLLDWRLVLSLVLSSFIWGSLLGLIRVLTSGELKNLLNNLKQMAQRQSVKASQLHRIPYTFALLFGFLSAITLQQLGWEWL